MPVNIRIAVGDEWGEKKPMAYRELVIERITNNDETPALPSNPNFAPEIVSEYRVRAYASSDHAGVHMSDPFYTRVSNQPRVVATFKHRYGDDALTLMKEALDAVHEQALLDGLPHV